MTASIFTSSQMHPAARTTKPSTIPRKPAVAMLVEGRPHCEMSPTKEPTAMRIPAPIVSRIGVQEIFGGAGPVSMVSSLRISITEVDAILLPRDNGVDASKAAQEFQATEAKILGLAFVLNAARSTFVP